MKWGWWQAVSGTPTITGRRLDAVSAPLQPWTSTAQVGDFATPLAFPSEGCWEITATVGTTQLTVVQLVLRAETEFARLRQLAPRDRAAALRLRELLQLPLARNRRKIDVLERRDPQGDHLLQLRRAVRELEAEVATLERRLIDP